MDYSLQEIGRIAGEVKRQMLKQSDQTETVKVPAGALAGVHTQSFTLDARYKSCSGVVLYVIKAPAGINFRVGVRDNNIHFVDKTSYKHIAASELTPANDRFKSVTMPAEGRKVYIEVELFEELASDLEFDIVFRLQEPNS